MFFLYMAKDGQIIQESEVKFPVYGDNGESDGLRWFESDNTEINSAGWYYDEQTGTAYLKEQPEEPVT